MKEQTCCSESVADIRSGMNWGFLQQTSIAQIWFGGLFSLSYNPPTIQNLVASHAPKEYPDVPVISVCLGACFQYLIQTFSGFSADESYLALNLNFPTNNSFKYILHSITVNPQI